MNNVKSGAAHLSKSSSECSASGSEPTHVTQNPIEAEAGRAAASACSFFAAAFLLNVHFRNRICQLIVVVSQKALCRQLIQHSFKVTKLLWLTKSGMRFTNSSGRWHSLQRKFWRQHSKIFT